MTNRNNLSLLRNQYRGAQIVIFMSAIFNLAVSLLIKNYILFAEGLILLLIFIIDIFCASLSVSIFFYYIFLTGTLLDIFLKILLIFSSEVEFLSKIILILFGLFLDVIFVWAVLVAIKSIPELRKYELRGINWRVEG